MQGETSILPAVPSPAQSCVDLCALEGEKVCPKSKPCPQAEMSCFWLICRMVEEGEAATGGYEDFLGQRHSDVSTDLYSSQFENILDNASLYYSAESLETLYSEPDSYFSFEMPLTPMIQQRMKEGGQFLDRTSALGQTDVLDREVKGCGEGIANGLRDASETLFKGDVTEVSHLER